VKQDELRSVGVEYFSTEMQRLHDRMQEHRYQIKKSESGREIDTSTH
jgi:hypothetical protein